MKTNNCKTFYFHHIHQKFTYFISFSKFQKIDFVLISWQASKKKILNKSDTKLNFADDLLKSMTLHVWWLWEWLRCFQFIFDIVNCRQNDPFRLLHCMFAVWCWCWLTWKSSSKAFSYWHLTNKCQFYYFSPKKEAYKQKSKWNSMPFLFLGKTMQILNKYLFHNVTEIFQTCNICQSFLKIKSNLNCHFHG